MGLRFRKTINLGGGARINISKSGIGGSVGVKGARITKTADGKTRKTFSVPGTGVSHISETSNKKGRPIQDTPVTLPNKVLSTIFKLMGALMIVFSCLLSLAIPPIGIMGIVFGIVLVVLGGYYKKKERKEEVNEDVSIKER